MTRYLRLLAIQVKTSAALAMQYRVEFLVEGALAVFWTFWSLLPIVVLFQKRQSVAGWSYEEALVVIGWFTLMKGILEGAVNPSLTSVVEHIRKGTLDFVLVKPADAQFLVSTARFEPWRVVDVAGALAIFAFSFARMHRAPSPLDVLAALGLLACAAVILYSMWIMVIAVAFYAVKIDNLSFLFSSLFDAARWPASVFRGALRVVFTFVIPLAIMTTWPALALLGKLRGPLAAEAVAAALAFAVLARFVWLQAIGKYTSASS